MSARLNPGDRERAERIVVASLARGLTNTDAARAAGISRRSLQTWLRVDPTLQHRIEQERIRLLDSQDPRAVAVLEELLHSTDERIRLQAASALLREAPETHQPEQQQPTTVIFNLPAKTLERMQADRHALYEEQSREFQARQAAEADSVERLYRQPKPTLRAVPGSAPQGDPP